MTISISCSDMHFCYFLTKFCFVYHVLMSLTDNAYCLTLVSCNIFHVFIHGMIVMCRIIVCVCYDFSTQDCAGVFM